MEAHFVYNVPMIDISFSDAKAHVLAAFSAQAAQKQPYLHYFIEDMLPPALFSALAAIQLAPIDLGGKSGERAAHNEGRHYFSPENCARQAALALVAQLFQDKDICTHIATLCQCRVEACYLRVEYALDVDGFWLEPHTDIGAKKYSLLYYLSGEGAADAGADALDELGTDIYDAQKRHVGRAPFTPNHAFAFVPSDITYHGFEPRKIFGVRKSLIINYVSTDWRAREQLSFPDAPIALIPA